MKKFNFFALLLIASTLVFSCKKTRATKNCNTTNTLFMSLYNSMATSASYTDHVTYDVLNHEYSFKTSISGTICSFGYQNQTTSPAMPNMAYQIELLDASNTVLYSGTHIFSSTQTSYVSVPPISINANQVYTLRRTVLPGSFGTDYLNVVGRVLNTPAYSTISFPITVGNLTITGSKCYDNGYGPLSALAIDKYLPCIDFAFN